MKKETYQRILDQFPRAVSDYHRRDFERQRTQHPDGCDCGHKIKKVQDHDVMFDQYDDDFE